jgi:hypothetical protein
MTITLYNCTDSSNRIDKTVANGLTVTGVMKNALDIDNISVDIQTPVETFNYNYCYVQELKRYYFIQTPVVSPNGIMTLPLVCDVLMSFKSTIENIVGTIGKRSNPQKYNSAFSANFDTRPGVERYNYTNNFDETGNIIMVTIRGTL